MSDGCGGLLQILLGGLPGIVRCCGWLGFLLVGGPSVSFPAIPGSTGRFLIVIPPRNAAKSIEHPKNLQRLYHERLGLDEVIYQC
jgi:hypothetical protein